MAKQVLAWWLNKCYCMDAIHLSGNIWINYFYAQGKSGKTSMVSVRSKERGSFGTAVYIYMSHIYILRYLVVG